MGNINIPEIRFPEFDGDWKDFRFGEIGKFSKGKGISKVDISEDGETECIRYGELYTTYNETIENVKSKTNIERKDLVLSEANDIIIPASGETQIDIATASCVLISGIALGGDLNIIKTAENGVFLSYYLNSKKKYDIAKLAQGISVVHLYSSQLSILNLNLPALPEQQKIASYFTTIDLKISQLKQKKTLLEQYKKGVMQKIFSQEIRFTDENGQEFPKWEKKRLGDLGKIIGGGTPETNRENYWNGNIQWFTPTEIKANYVRKSVRTISEDGFNKSSAKLLPKGTILLTTRATIGECAIAMEECTTNQGFQSIVVDSKNNNIFILNWLKHNKNELIKRANGSTFIEISSKEIKSIPILKPVLSEQNKIAYFFSAIDDKIYHTKTQLEKAELWKKGLLQKMFV